MASRIHCMAIIIDGYNLMHVTRFAIGPNDRRRLDESRNQMLAFLGDHLNTVGERDVTVVFDSDVTTHRFPDEQSLFGLRVLFAREYPTADDLIEELVANYKSSNLTVVSSDHRIQVFASRKRAAVVDSDVWFDQLLEQYSIATKHRDDEPTDATAGIDDAADTKEIEKDGIRGNFENPFPEGYGEDLG